jgi:hypothetical protein
LTNDREEKLERNSDASGTIFIFLFVKAAKKTLKNRLRL